MSTSAGLPEARTSISAHPAAGTVTSPTIVKDQAKSVDQKLALYGVSTLDLFYQRSGGRWGVKSRRDELGAELVSALPPISSPLPSLSSLAFLPPPSSPPPRVLKLILISSSSSQVIQAFRDGSLPSNKQIE